MDNLSRFRRVLAVVIVLAILATVPWAAGRVARENAARRVELTIDFQEFAAMAGQQGLDLSHLLAELRAAGVTAAGVSEATVKTLSDRGQVAMLSGADVLALAAAGANPPAGLREALAVGNVRAGDTYLIAADPATAANVATGLQWHLPPGTVSRLSPTAIWVKANVSVVATTPVYIPAEDIRAATAAGLAIVPRWAAVNNPTPAYLQGVLASLPAQTRIPLALPLGAAVPGNPGLEGTFASLLAEHGIMWGVIENEEGAMIRFRGDEAILQAAGANVARVWTTTADLSQLANVRPELLAAEAAKEAVDHNVRVIYLHPLMAAPPGKNLEQLNVEYVQDIVRDLRTGGLLAGPVKPYMPFRVPWLVVAAVLAGVAATWLWLWAWWPRTRHEPSWPLAVGVATAAWAIVYMVSRLRLLAGEKIAILALMAGAAVAVAVLGPWREGGRRIAEQKGYWAVLADGLAAMIFVAVVAVAGGLVLAVLTAAPGYRLGLSGLGSAGLWATIMVVLAWLCFESLGRPDAPWAEARASIGRLLVSPIRLGDVFLVLLVAVVGVLPVLAVLPVPGASLFGRLAAAGMPAPLTYLVAWPLVVASPVLRRFGRRWHTLAAIAAAYLVVWPLAAMAAGTSALEVFFLSARGFWLGAVAGALAVSVIRLVAIRTGVWSRAQA